MRTAIASRLLPALPYWQWWIGELTAMVPERWRRAGSRPRVCIRCGVKSVEVERSAAGQTEVHRDERPISELDDTAWAELAGLTADAEVIALLPDAQLLGLKLKLPRATLRSLDDAIRLQLLRESPLEPDALLWTRQVERVTAKEVEVSVRLARRIDVDVLGARFTAAGLAAPAIGCDGPAGIQILQRGTPTEPSDVWRADRRAGWIALALLASIPLTTFALLAMRTNAAEQRILALTDAAGERTRAASRLRSAAAASRELNALATRESLSGAVERIAKRLPQGAWIAAVRIAPGANLEADIITSDPASLTEFAIVGQRPEREGRFRVTVRAPR